MMKTALDSIFTTGAHLLLVCILIFAGGLPSATSNDPFSYMLFWGGLGSFISNMIFFHFYKPGKKRRLFLETLKMFALQYITVVFFITASMIFAGDDNNLWTDFFSLFFTFALLSMAFSIKTIPFLIGADYLTLRYIKRLPWQTLSR